MTNQSTRSERGHPGPQQPSKLTKVWIPPQTCLGPEWASLGAQNLPAMRGVTKSRRRLNDFHFTMQDAQVRLLGQEDPLKKEMATHASVLAWEIPWTEESGELQSMGSQELDMI